MARPDLTDIQRMVLLLVGDGLPDRRIAEEMVTGVSAVRQHIQNLKRLFGVKHKHELVLKARRYFGY